MINKIIQSSQNPEQVSLRVKGILMSLVGIVVLLGGPQAYGVEYLSEGVEHIASVMGTLALLIGNLQLLWGWIRSFKK